MKNYKTVITYSIYNISKDIDRQKCLRLQDGQTGQRFARDFEVLQKLLKIKVLKINTNREVFAIYLGIDERYVVLLRRPKLEKMLKYTFFKDILYTKKFNLWPLDGIFRSWPKTGQAAQKKREFAT